MHTRATARLAVLMVALAAPVARAQTPPRRPEIVQEAAERFDRGVRLFNQGDNAGALAEFKRAQDLTGDPLIFFNIGLVYAEMKRSVEAVDALDRLLASSATISADQRQKAQRVRQEQWASIAFLQIDVSVPAVIEVDGVEVAHTPIDEPLRVVAGSHVVGAVATGYAPSRKEIDVAGGEKRKLTFSLVPTEVTFGHVGIHSALPGAGVWIDGKLVGQTPLVATIAIGAGDHRIELRRQGYHVAAQDVKIDVGALADVTLEPDIDQTELAANGGNLIVRASEPGASVTIDGRPATMSDSIQLPAGDHHLLIARSGFNPEERQVTIDRGANATVTVRLEPTPDTREAYAAHIRDRRIVGWSIAGVGVAAVVVGAILVTTGRTNLDSANSNLAAVDQARTRFGGGQCDPSLQIDPVACSAILAAANQRVSDANTRITAGYIGGGIGAAAAIVGVVVLLTGDDADRYDRKSVAYVRPALSAWAVGNGGGLVLGGRF